MKQVQLVLAPYRPDKYQMGLLEYDYWKKRVDIFLGFLDEHDKKRYIGENNNKSIVKPYLISPDDKFKSGDMIYHIPTMEVLQCGGFMHSEKFEDDDVVHERGYSYQKDCRKVIATPDQTGWYVTDNLGDSKIDKIVSLFQSILNNDGKCFVGLDESILPARKSEQEIYSTVIEQIRKEIEKPLLIDGKVVIYLNEEK